MNRNKFYVILGWFVFLFIPIFAITLFYFNEKISTDPPTEIVDKDKGAENDSSDSNNDSGENSNDKEEKSEESEEDSENGSDNDNSDKEDSQDIYWGMDSASATDENLYSCAKESFGDPKIWGRYLGDKDDVSIGLDNDEVEFLHEKDVKILVIYNHFEDAAGYEHGVSEAEEAISFAEDLNIPEDVSIFGDIEPNYPVDSAFLDGWYETLANSKYNSGIYGVFDEDSKLLEAYNATSENTKEDTVIWTADPQEGISTKDNAPDYKPQGPENANIYGWQYGQDADECDIDTNLFKKEILDFLW